MIRETNRAVLTEHVTAQGDLTVVGKQITLPSPPVSVDTEVFNKR